MSRSHFIILFFISLFAFIPGPVLAFDRLICESNLKQWTIHSETSEKNELINQFSQTTVLAKEVSAALIMQDRQGRKIASILPWNGVLFLKSKMAQSQKYVFNFETDDNTWFNLEVTEPKSAIKQKISCKFTF